jgi:hypothetical protein
VVGEVANSTETCPVKHGGEADKIPLVFVQPHMTDKTPNKITLTLLDVPQHRIAHFWAILSPCNLCCGILVFIE